MAYITEIISKQANPLISVTYFFGQKYSFASVYGGWYECEAEQYFIEFERDFLQVSKNCQCFSRWFSKRLQKICLITSISLGNKNNIREPFPRQNRYYQTAVINTIMWCSLFIHSHEALMKTACYVIGTAYGCTKSGQQGVCQDGVTSLHQNTLFEKLLVLCEILRKMVLWEDANRTFCCSFKIHLHSKLVRPSACH